MHYLVGPPTTPLSARTSNPAFEGAVHRCRPAFGWGWRRWLAMEGRTAGGRLSEAPTAACLDAADASNRFLILWSRPRALAPRWGWPARHFAWLERVARSRRRSTMATTHDGAGSQSDSSCRRPAPSRDRFKRRRGGAHPAFSAQFLEARRAAATTRVSPRTSPAQQRRTPPDGPGGFGVAPFCTMSTTTRPGGLRPAHRPARPRPRRPRGAACPAGVASRCAMS